MLLSELANILGAAFFTFLFLVRVMETFTGEWIALPLALQSGLAAFLLVMHRPAARSADPISSTAAWFCVLLPLAFDFEDANMLWSLPGLLLALWSLTALGFSFSITPEDRGIVTRGPYRHVRHPMYLGEFLSTFGLCISASNPWNWAALSIFVLLVLVRISAEECALTGYSRYREAVRWRLLPFIW
jgi:hypothetical protein